MELRDFVLFFLFYYCGVNFPDKIFLNQHEISIGYIQFIHFSLYNFLLYSFQLKKFSQNEIILVDDINTTGSTLRQAIDRLNREKKEVLLCLTLADVSLK